MRLSIFALLFPACAVFAVTDQRFDNPNSLCGAGTACVEATYLHDPAPALFKGGPTGIGRFLRLGYADPVGGLPAFNTISFEQTDDAADLIVADFDFRITPGQGRADGMGFSLLNVAHYGVSGEVVGTAEEADFTDSLGVGFDLYRNGSLDDIGNDAVRAKFSNSISIHYNGVIAQADATPVIDIGCSLWLHARIIVDAAAAVPAVTVQLGAPDCELMTVVDAVPVPGLVPYASRAHFGARSGGESADFDIDNVKIHYADAHSKFVALSHTSYGVFETEPEAVITLMRFGDTSGTTKVRAKALQGSPSTPINAFTPTSRTLTFDPGETKKDFKIPIHNNGSIDASRIFEVKLRSLDAETSIAGPANAGVYIFDDETSALNGHWDRLVHWPIVGVHVSLLPNGEVIYWDRLGGVAQWDSVTGEASMLPMTDYNLFCSGHAFLADGTLLVAGGHADPMGHTHADGVGEEELSAYNFTDGSWTVLPPMNAGRWYPTNTLLPNGDMLILSGTIGGFFDTNTLPQIWQPASSTWRNLTNADLAFPLGVELYPRMLVAPDGRVFKAGVDQQCWYLDTTGTGQWIMGPENNTGAHIYGTATMYRPGKILITGGSDLAPGGVETIAPNATAEVINLNDAEPEWRTVQSMSYARRHQNASMLPDGTVLITGGTSGLGESNPRTPVMDAEIWDPETETFRMVATMRVPRLYHSTALLLPDGRVLSVGGGQGANTTGFQNLAELYSPPYLFKGERPVIEKAPDEIAYGSKFTVKTPQYSGIERVALIRLPSVTHAFDMNQGFTFLKFKPVEGGIRLQAPETPFDVRPGYQMLFVLNASGVPSVAKILKLSPQAP